MLSSYVCIIIYVHCAHALRETVDESNVLDVSITELESDSIDNENEYIVPEHKKLILNVCDGNLFGHRATRNLLSGLVGGFKAFVDAFCGALAFGSAWPDCPTRPEKASMAMSCLKNLPFHAGMKEMIGQAIRGKFQRFGFVPQPQKGFYAYKMGAVRAAVQHEHASPLLPLHLPDGRHIALTSNRQFRGKMVAQALEWHCKASHLIERGLAMLPSSVDRPSRTKLLIRKRMHAFNVGLAFAGKILHMVGDSFSMSHVRRVLKEDSARRAYFDAEERVRSHKASSEYDLELLRNASIDFAYTMDDVDWSKHAAWDSESKRDKPHSDKRVMKALGYIATRHVLSSLRPLFDGFFDKFVISEDNGEPMLARTRGKCGDAVRGAVPREGTHLFSWKNCKCPRGSIMVGQHRDCNTEIRKFRSYSLKGKGCHCKNEGWAGLCYVALKSWTRATHVPQPHCSNRRGIICTRGRRGSACLPLQCRGQKGLLEREHVSCANAGNSEGPERETREADAVTKSKGADASRIRLGRVLCDDIFSFVDLDGGAGGSSADVGRNKQKSEWRAQLADDMATKRQVSAELNRLISDVDNLRKNGKTMGDQKIAFKYPGPNDVDICKRLNQLSCEDLSVPKRYFLRDYTLLREW